MSSGDKVAANAVKQIATHVDAPQSLELAILPSDRLGKGAVNVQSNDAHASPFVSLV